MTYKCAGCSTEGRGIQMSGRIQQEMALRHFLEAANAVDLDLKAWGYYRPSGILQHWLIKERDALAALRAAGCAIKPKHEPEATK